ncbi:cell division ATP-binding protein FtsE [candidate division LCP-89 bacterium B3_LCP]|uniref:Cell division ATP-binding protein FtsE n=1 Tax=candidate division LCP-89 bacterium B3_LCP TaxID=2012998 RepID=A0A532V5C4_UNCL8|nr:MAG: cell division ATP-binding protein FtsE [candidate division LCP-89 bacterium B3_LCP]
MIRFVNVSLEHQPDRGISGISFVVKRGEFVLLNGPTGAGKTTILRTIYREIHPDSGQVIIDGQFQPNCSGHDLSLLRRKMGIVFPEPHLLTDRNLFENVAFPLRIEGQPRRKVRLQVNRMLFRFGLQARSKSFPAELSSGEQKKGAIARALIGRPFILLADEPLANIDHDASLEILDILRQINEEGMTILAATHIPEPFKGIAHRTLHLKDGRLSHGS